MRNRPEKFGMWVAAILWAGLSLASQVQTSEAQTTDAEWKRVVIDGKFSIEMPGEPKKSTQTVDTPAGQLTLSMYMLEMNGGSAGFVGAATDFPAVMPEPRGDEIEQRLDGSQQGAADNCKGKLLSSKKIKIDGYSGRDVLIQAPGGLMLRCRIYLVRKTLLQVQAINIDSKEADRFFASMKLVKDATPPGDKP
jgi:hypothetical protein